MLGIIAASLWFINVVIFVWRFWTGYCDDVVDDLGTFLHRIFRSKEED